MHISLAVLTFTHLFFKKMAILKSSAIHNSEFTFFALLPGFLAHKINQILV